MNNRRKFLKYTFSILAVSILPFQWLITNIALSSGSNVYVTTMNTAMHMSPKTYKLFKQHLLDLAK